MNKQRKFILAAAAVGIIATFLPWATLSAGAFGYNVNQSLNGFHGMGVVYFILLIAAVIIAVMGNQSETLQKNMRLATIGAGVLALLSLLIVYSGIKEEIGGSIGAVDVSIGFGMILSFLAAAAVALIPFIIKQPGETLGNDLAQLKSGMKSIQNNIANAAPATPKEPSKSKVDELQKLIDLRNAGDITQAEYEDLKSKII